MALAGHAGFCKAGRLTGGRSKMTVSPTATAALAEHKRLFTGHIVYNFIGLRIADQRPPGHPNGEGLSILPAAPRTLAVSAVASHIFSFIAEIHQCGHMVIHLHNNISTPAAVSAIRAAGGNIFFPVKRNSTVAALSGFDGDACLIYERCRHSSGTSFV